MVILLWGTDPLISLLWLHPPSSTFLQTMASDSKLNFDAVSSSQTTVSSHTQGTMLPHPTSATPEAEGHSATASDVSSDLFSIYLLISLSPDLACS